MNSGQQKNAKASQDMLVIDEIRDGVVILKNGGLRAILMTSSINLGLKSVDEQRAILAQYQSLLNTLDFSVQFSVQSRRLNISPYLESLEQRRKEETNELLKIQTTEYIQFMKALVDTENIVTKTFYAVIPYDPGLVSAKGGFINSLFPGATAKKQPLAQERFEEYRAQLLQRVDVVVQGLAHVGLKSTLLGTEEVTELFHGLYNPDEAESRALAENIKQN